VRPAEVAIAFDVFRLEVERLKGVDLLDRWIAFEGIDESQVPDLGKLKSFCLEDALNLEFGRGNWQGAVRARKQARATDAEEF
jgi:hypothetical protein